MAITPFSGFFSSPCNSPLSPLSLSIWLVFLLPLTPHLSVKSTTELEEERHTNFYFPPIDNLATDEIWPPVPAESSMRCERLASLSMVPEFHFFSFWKASILLLPCGGANWTGMKGEGEGVFAREEGRFAAAGKLTGVEEEEEEQERN